MTDAPPTPAVDAEREALMKRMVNQVYNLETDSLDPLAIHMANEITDWMHDAFTRAERAEGDLIACRSSLETTDESWVKLNAENARLRAKNAGLREALSAMERYVALHAMDRLIIDRNGSIEGWKKSPFLCELLDASRAALSSEQAAAGERG